ncbi:hypothetical protein OS493_010721, partial [Desmophyllum pertusum]
LNLPRSGGWRKGGRQIIPVRRPRVVEPAKESASKPGEEKGVPVATQTVGTKLGKDTDSPRNDEVTGVAADCVELCVLATSELGAGETGDKDANCRPRKTCCTAAVIMGCRYGSRLTVAGLWNDGRRASR